MLMRSQLDHTATGDIPFFLLNYIAKYKQYRGRENSTRFINSKVFTYRTLMQEKIPKLQVHKDCDTFEALGDSIT